VVPITTALSSKVSPTGLRGLGANICQLPQARLSTELTQRHGVFNRNVGPESPVAAPLVAPDWGSGDGVSGATGATGYATRSRQPIERTSVPNIPAYRAPHVRWRLNSSGSFAIFREILRASSRVNNFAADLRPGSSSKWRRQVAGRCDRARQSTLLVLRQTRAAGSGAATFIIYLFLARRWWS
jgi:hypothetical protein